MRLGQDADYRTDLGRRIYEASDVLFEDAQTIREHERVFAKLIEETRSR